MRATGRSSAWWLGGLTAAVAVVGCASTGGGPAGPPVSAVRHPSLEDFPVPSGFTWVVDASESRSAGAMRWVEYQFEGRDSLGAMIRFFKEKLPEAGWTLRSEGLTESVYWMRFESEREECDVRLHATMTKTIIKVDIAPLPVGAADRLPARTRRG